MNQIHRSLKKRRLKFAAVFICMIFIAGSASQAQSMDNSEREVKEVNPRNALLRSFVMPGWGHHYIDRQNWRRGQYHLAAEVVLIVSYLGFRTHSHVLEQNMYTMASAHSGIQIKDRERNFQLAVGNYDSLDEYNDYQERSRNLDRTFPDTPEYQWAWESSDKRFEYRDMRGRWDQTNQQLPALLSLMVINRVISGLSAFSQARTHNTNIPQLSLTYNPNLHSGMQANLSFQF
ncbi:MAG: hypothetical protein WD037_05510 [Balneolales bacterium]